MKKNKKGILKINLFGSDYPVTLKISRYQENGGLYLGLLDAGDEEYGGSFADITVNMGCRLPNDCAAVKNYSENEGMEKFLVENGLGKPTGQGLSSGYVTVPVFKFDMDRLEDLEAEGLEQFYEGEV